jgi:hypothetical protein
MSAGAFYFPVVRRADERRQYYLKPLGFSREKLRGREGKYLPVNQVDIDILPIVGDIFNIVLDRHYVRMRGQFRAKRVGEL